MNKVITAGTVAGAAAGLVYYAVISSAKPIKKHNIKKHATKAMKAAECLFSDLTSFM